MNLFNHHFIDLSGARIYLERYRNQPFLLVNVATGGRFAPQLERLQQIHTQFGLHGLVVLAVPSNDFGDEPRDAEGIEDFLRENYPFSYIVTRPCAVTGVEAHPLFREMLQEKGSAALPTGSFCKYLFDRRGELVEHWGSHVQPDEPGLVRSINQHLGSL